ncbi:hypothetical protein [Mycobacterium sp. D16R24]|uniref:hypothetical protein n=1 Tax=Mycobacterium sp. D16R24 TaxID=1855656 RepID=UPI00256FAB4B|nr:hypothetical protein [Mycobacterium sp. D16R24]
MSADVWAAIAQWMTVAIAGGALVYARGQVREARETRERVAQPDVVVFVDRHEVRRYFDLVIRNFGQTTAYNIRLTLPPLQVAHHSDDDTGDVESLYVPESIAVLAPGQEWRTVWDSAVRREEYLGPLQAKYIGRVDFDDKMLPDKPSYSNPISLDTNMFRNTTWIETTKSKTVQDALYDIAGTLKGYTTERRGVWVYTTSGQSEREYRERLAQHHEDQFERMLREIMGDDRRQGDG